MTFLYQTANTLRLDVVLCSPFSFQHPIQHQANIGYFSVAYWILPTLFLQYWPWIPHPALFSSLDFKALQSKLASWLWWQLLMAVTEQKDVCSQWKQCTEMERILHDCYLFVLHMPVCEYTCVHLCQSSGFAEREANSIRSNQKTRL